MSLNSFNYTEPAGGTKFRTYDSGGIHAQVVVIGGTDTLALPTDSTYGLSVDVKRIAAGSSIYSILTDPTDSTLHASVINNLFPDIDEPAAAVREVTLAAQVKQLLTKMDQMIALERRMVGALEKWIGGPREPIALPQPIGV